MTPNVKRIGAVREVGGWGLGTHLRRGREMDCHIPEGGNCKL